MTPPEREDPIASTGPWDVAHNTVAPTASDATSVRRPWWTCRRSRLRLAVIGAGVLLVTGVAWPIYHAWAQPRIGNSELPAVDMVLPVLKFTQEIYRQHHGGYASSGAALRADGNLIAADLAAAFETWQNNGDSLTPTPKVGQVLRMLQGDYGQGLTSFQRPATPTADANAAPGGLRLWAATCRAVDPDNSDGNQYLILATGQIYQHAEPPPDDSQYKTFLLAVVPDLCNPDGSVDETWLAKKGWTRYATRR